jgi:putative SOS response-associated peptidase YedK
VCGRYAASKDTDQLVEEFEVTRVDDTSGLAANYNVAPTTSVPVVLERLTSGEEPSPERALRVVRWGLVPSWAKDIKIGSRMINARAEQAAAKPAFRAAMRRRRCIVPADGYYEWYRPEGASASGKPFPKQPFFIHRRDGGTVAMAGLYEAWRDPSVTDDDDPTAWVRTMTILTTDAADNLAGIHDRMPVILDPTDYRRWLDPRLQDPHDVADLLRPTATEVMTAYAVSTQVNNVRNNGAELLDPVT